MPLSRSFEVSIVIFFIWLLPNTAISNSHNADTRPTQVNKTFLVTLHITQDINGVPAADGARVTAISNAIDNAGDYFERIGVDFEVGDVLFIDNYNLDIIETEEELEEFTANYDQPNRINLYVFSAYAGAMAGGCGIAAGDNTSNVSGLFMAEPCINAVSFAHEVGHFFGLAHTFTDAGTAELVDGSNCLTEGDQICDTPADPYVPGSGENYVQDCAFVYEGQDANGDYFDPMISNIMSYYFEDCDCELSFTDGQLEVVAATYYANTDRW